MNSPSNNKRRVSLFAAYENVENRFSIAPESKKETHDFHQDISPFTCSAFCDTSDSDENIENPESPAAPIFKIERLNIQMSNMTISAFPC